MAPSRVMVVDDFKEWRRTVCSILGQQEELLVVGEASDGTEAIQKAGELQPDLIVLDVGLPNLNGIEAAPRISDLSPGSKIIFLSQDNDVSTVRAALSGGAWGYVHKSSAVAELLNAVTAVLKGHTFVSSNITGEELIGKKPRTLTGTSECKADIAHATD